MAEVPELPQEQAAASGNAADIGRTAECILPGLQDRVSDRYPPGPVLREPEPVTIAQACVVRWLRLSLSSDDGGGQPVAEKEEAELWRQIRDRQTEISAGNAGRNLRPWGHHAEFAAAASGRSVTTSPAMQRTR